MRGRCRVLRPCQERPGPRAPSAPPGRILEPPEGSGWYLGASPDGLLRRRATRESRDASGAAVHGSRGSRRGEGPGLRRLVAARRPGGSGRAPRRLLHGACRRRGGSRRPRRGRKAPRLFQRVPPSRRASRLRRGLLPRPEMRLPRLDVRPGRPASRDPRVRGRRKFPPGGRAPARIRCGDVDRPRVREPRCRRVPARRDAGPPGPSRGGRARLDALRVPAPVDSRLQLEGLRGQLSRGLSHPRGPPLSHGGARLRRLPDRDLPQPRAAGFADQGKGRPPGDRRRGWRSRVLVDLAEPHAERLPRQLFDEPDRAARRGADPDDLRVVLSRARPPRRAHEGGRDGSVQRRDPARGHRDLRGRAARAEVEDVPPRPLLRKAGERRPSFPPPLGGRDGALARPGALMELRRVLGFRDLVFFYTLTCFSLRWIATAAEAGPSSLVVWVLAAFGLFVPLVASVLELSSRHPEEGGLYVWTRRAFGDFPGFIAGFLYWASNLPFFPALLYFTAANALFLGGARGAALQESRGFFLVFSLVGVILASAANIRGLKYGTWLHNAAAVATWIPAIRLVLCGAVVFARFGSATSFSAAHLIPSAGLKDALFFSTIAFAFGGI